MVFDELHTGGRAAAVSFKTESAAPLENAGIPAEDRYSRQVLFPGIGASGQRLLRGAHTAIVGCGATGAALAALLSRAGVGTLTLIDRDFVEPSNLQRQMLFDEADALASIPKAEAARRHLGSINSDVVVRARVADLTPATIEELLSGAQIILDGTDNFETRYLLNDFAVQQGLPWIYAAAIGGYAATMNILPKRAQGATAEAEGPGGALPTCCLACVFPAPPAGAAETCDTAGVLSMAVTLAASIQAAEAVKFLTGQAGMMRRTLLSFDLWTPTAQGGIERSEVAAGTPRPGCGVCGERVFSHLAGRGRAQITLCGRDSVQIHERHRTMDFDGLRRRLAGHADIRELRANELLLRFRRGRYTVTIFEDGRAIVQGTTDISVARSLYARFVGT